MALLISQKKDIPGLSISFGRGLFSALLFFALFLSLSCTSAKRTTAGDAIDRTFAYAGLPEVTDYPNPITILYNEGYVAGYDEIRGLPAWVAYRVFRVDEYMTHPRPGRFLIDERTDNRVSHDDYTNSGYDRGHMAPNFAIVTRYGREAQRETFLMSNIIPQTPQLNRQWWANLERLIARDYSESYGDVWVIIGPVFKVTGEWLGDLVKVPSHNFKIIKVEADGELRMKAFLVPQQVPGSDPPDPYLISVEEIEGLTGLQFHPLLPAGKADRLESVRADRLWDSE